MSSPLVLRSYPQNPNAFKIMVAAKFGGVNVEYDSNIKMGQDNKTPEFLKKHPLGKVPVLETPEGGIAESNAIARYVARVGSAATQLLGVNAYEEAKIAEWIDFSSNYLSTHGFAFWGYTWGFFPFNQENFNKHLEAHKQAWGWIEAQLANHGKPFIVGDHVTLADIVIGTTLVNTVKLALDAEFRSQFPKTDAYLQSLFALDQFKSVLGEVKPLEKFVPPQ